MHKLKEKTLEFPSIIENVRLVETFIDDICDEYNINNTYFGNILISLTESVRNAIINGNHKNPQKKVTVKFIAKPTHLSFSVTDEGIGFNYRDVYDPVDFCMCNSNMGKGLYLIKTLSDKVRFYKNGREIELIFYISSVNFEITVERVNKIKIYFKDRALPGYNLN
jgi:serine/threonine-protein kinase RsbW